MSRPKITFPHLGSYYLPLSYIFSNISSLEVITPPPITKKTIVLGSRYSPDYVCAPFKYNIGNYLEALEKGATILVQAGGGCRYGYYAELQEQILKDLGYSFKFVNFIHHNHVSLRKIYKFAKGYNKKLNIFSYLYYVLIGIVAIIVMDKLDNYYRKHSGFTIKKNEMKYLKLQFEKELLNNMALIQLIKLYKKYLHLYKKCPINKPSNCLKVGIVGELYTIMEPFSNYNIEDILINNKIEVTRTTNLTYLLITKRFKLKKHLFNSKKYIKYHLGADATETVALALKYAGKGYDGVLHIKSTYCTPEVSATNIVDRISNDYNIPILHFSFDTSTSTTGIMTRMEAFYDMLIMKKK